MTDNTNHETEASILSFFEGGLGAPALKFEKKGQKYTGVITFISSPEPTKDVATGEINRDKLQVRIILELDEENDGCLYITSADMKKKYLKACKAASVHPARAVDRTLTIEYVGDGQPHTKGVAAPKLYNISVK